MVKGVKQTRGLDHADFRIRCLWTQFERSHESLLAAKRCKKLTSQFREVLAGVYFGRSVAELMCEIVKKQGFQGANDRAQNKLHEAKAVAFDNWIRPKVPRYRLIYLVRLNDFHKVSIPAPTAGRVGWSISGGFRLSTPPGGGVATYRLGESLKDNPNVSRAGHALQYGDGWLDDTDAGDRVPLGRALSEYLEAMPRVIDEFEAMLARGEWDNLPGCGGNG